jgi:hypothetical protein
MEGGDAVPWDVTKVGARCRDASKQAGVTREGESRAENKAGV